MKKLLLPLLLLAAMTANAAENPVLTIEGGQVKGVFADDHPDVEQFPGHIACSSLSRSEIVVPIYNKESEVVGVLDIDSTELGTFDDIDRQYLEQLSQLLTRNLY